MSQYYSGRIDAQRFLDDFSWIDRGAVDCAAKQLIKAQHAVAIVKIQAAEKLMLEVLHSGLEESLGVCRTLNRLAAGQGLLEVSARELGQCAQSPEACPADTSAGQKIGAVGMQQRSQTAKAEQELAGRFSPGRVAAAGAEQRGQQLDVGTFLVGDVFHTIMLLPNGISLQRINLPGMS